MAGAEAAATRPLERGEDCGTDPPSELLQRTRSVIPLRFISSFHLPELSGVQALALRATEAVLLQAAGQNITTSTLHSTPFCLLVVVLELVCHSGTQEKGLSKEERNQERRTGRREGEWRKNK